MIWKAHGPPNGSQSRKWVGPRRGVAVCDVNVAALRLVPHRDSRAARRWQCNSRHFLARELHCEYQSGTMNASVTAAFDAAIRAAMIFRVRHSAIYRLYHARSRTHHREVT